MDLNTVSFVAGAIKLAWEVYDKGFKKEKSSPQRYIEFGSALHGLYSNLKTIESIVTRANNALENDRIGVFGAPTYDLSPLTDIIGNFKLTLEECKELLNDESKFSQKNGVITNIIYNIDVDPYVIQLTERLAFHNNKISLVLDPFKLHLQSQLRSLLIEQHQDLAEKIQELKELVVSGRDVKDEPLSPARRRDLEVPEAINQRFDDACGPRGRTENRNRTFASFPLRDGLEAFFYHFTGISQPVDSMSYLRLLKSIWIMDRIRAGTEFRKTESSNPGGLYDRCVREMDRRLRAECSRVTQSQITLPVPELLLQLPDEAFSIWPPEAQSIRPANVHHLGVLLDIPILPEPKSHTLRIVRNIDGTLGLEDTTVTTTESTATLSSETRIQTMNIDPKSAYFVPIYAMPTEAGSNSAALTVKLQSSRDGVNGVTPQFESPETLLKLQHLITGFKCVKRRNGVAVTSLAEGQFFPSSDTGGKKSKKTPKELLEFGNLQMWQKVPFDNASTASDRLSDTARRASGLSSGTGIKSIGSSMSFSSIGSMSTAHMQQVTVGSSVGIQLQEPEPPYLVLFLKEKEQGLLSFLMVELDEYTHINTFSCNCASARKPCTISVLERSKKPLLARRFYAREGLNSWNLAALGEHWASTLNGAIQVQNMYWLRINFRQESERVKFGVDLERLVTIFKGRMDDYRKDLDRVRRTSIISRGNC